MGRDDRGKVAITEVTLRPAILFSGTPPDAATLDGLHHRAHEACYIANSIRAEVVSRRADRWRTGTRSAQVRCRRLDPG